MELKTKIQNLRKMKQLSQEKLAECLGISRQAIAKWENGESFPDINNLIQISNLFNITIDRLLKEDNCIDAIIHDNQKENDEIIPFLISAKKSTYAGSAEEQAKSTRPKSHDLIYENGHYQYIDTYLGGERFLGEEAVFVDGNPVWAMNYNGNEIKPCTGSKSGGYSEKQEAHIQRFLYRSPETHDGKRAHHTKG